MIKFLAVALLLASVLADDKPADPVWPKKFKQDFNEKIAFPLHFTENTSGAYLYDEDAGCYRIERADCHNDRYVLASGKCNHIVVAGNRYLYKPEKNTCCFCCNAAHGCGILKHDWMTGAEFLGEQDYTTADGQTVKAYKWNKPGLQSNYYFETVDADPLKRTMLQINQTPDDDMKFNPHSLFVEFDDDVCDLPSVCNLDTKCTWSVCSGLRGEEEEVPAQE